MKKRGTTNSSEATREKLLKAGLQEFGEHGYATVSTRTLAESAGVNLAAIPYHFGGKEGLYKAIIEDIIEEAQHRFLSSTREIYTQLNRGPVSVESGERMLRELIQNIVQFLVGQERNDDHFRASIIIRELMTPSDEFDQLYEGYMNDAHKLITHIVASLLHEPPESEESILRAHALIGQIVFFSAGRNLIKVRTQKNEFSQNHLDKITKTVTETFLYSIRGMRSARGIDSPAQ